MTSLSGTSFTSPPEVAITARSKLRSIAANPFPTLCTSSYW